LISPCAAYDSFIKSGMPKRAGTLVPAARRAAHHIRHLLREQAAANAEFLRNNDAAIETSRTHLPRHPLHLVLDNVRSAYNVGSIFRTADTARCAEVVTCGFTPHPPNPKLAKTAFGAIESVPTRHEESTIHAVRALQASGIAVYAMETTARSQNYCDVAFPSSGVALVLGNEQTGVDTQVMELVDGIVEIPTLGLKNSLNVATASGIVTFEALRQWGALSEGSSQPPAGADQ
jgi:23S rRNA (guanosine2251-2'-O)-methyltransferase